MNNNFKVNLNLRQLMLKIYLTEWLNNRVNNYFTIEIIFIVIKRKLLKYLCPQYLFKFTMKFEKI